MRRRLLSFAVSAAAFGLFTHLAFASTTAVLVPNADGNYTQWTPSTGTTHYTTVNETPRNGATNYNSTGTTGDRDSYGVNLASVGDGAVISQVDIVPCTSRNSNGNGTATSNVFYRFNGADSADAGNYALSGTTPAQLATTTFPSLNLIKTSTSTLEIGAVFSAGTKGARLSRIATVITYTLTIPVGPSNLVTTNNSSSQNNLSWTDNSNNELGFKIYRSQNGGSYSQIATTTMNAVSYSDTGLSADQTYSYYVTAYNSAGESDIGGTIAFDSATSAQSSSPVTTFTFPHTVTSTGANRMLIVGLATCAPISSVTYGGVRMNPLGSESDWCNGCFATLYDLKGSGNRPQ
jgi:hypothetical protein